MGHVTTRESIGASPHHGAFFAKPAACIYSVSKTPSLHFIDAVVCFHSGGNALGEAAAAVTNSLISPFPLRVEGGGRVVHHERHQPKTNQRMTVFIKHSHTKYDIKYTAVDTSKKGMPNEKSTSWSLHRVTRKGSSCVPSSS